MPLPHVTVDRVDLVCPPSSVFNILVMGQGFSSGEIADSAGRAWKEIRRIAFGNVGRSYSQRLSVFYDDNTSLNLGLTRSSTGALAIPSASSAALTNRIQQLTVKDQHGVTWPGATVWPAVGVAGTIGGLVLLLVKKSSTIPSGELYQLIPTATNPLAVAGVVVDGTTFWGNVLARAVAQKMAALYDEYSLDGNDFNSPPLQTVIDGPNIATVTPDEITSLQPLENQNPPSKDALIAALPIQWADRWNVDAGDVTKVVLRHNSVTNDIFPAGTVNNRQLVVVEGGGGFRHNVIRGSFDCLMRRIPLDAIASVSPGLLVQEQVSLCLICTNTITALMNRGFNFMARLPTTLKTQRREFQRVTWNSVTSKAPTVGQSFTGSTTGTPQWSFSAVVDATGGLTISDLQFTQRGDPFSAFVPTVMKKISYGPFSATLTDGTTVPLDLSSALNNKALPPVLKTASTGASDPNYLYGLELILTFPTSQWWYEAILSLVLKAPSYDFDPGDALKAAKFYPQAALRWFKPTKKQRGGSAPSFDASKKVRTLKGQVNLTSANSVPTSAAAQLQPLGLDDLASGVQGAAFFADTNATDDDNVYLFENVASNIGNEAMLLIGQYLIGAPPPDFDIQSATRVSGRKLAGAVPVGLTPGTFPGGAARYEYLVDHKIPGLPFWSWLFDYAIPIAIPAAGNSVVVEAVYSPEDSDAGFKAKGQGQRELLYKWPPANKLTASSDQNNLPVMKIRKLARQGEYDNIHQHAVPAVQTFTEAPFCGDVCIHLHWRWGTIATKPAKDLFRLVGWGDGGRGRGAHTTIGAPLIPPNQHLQIKATRIDVTSCEVDYIVTANNPPIDTSQVFLEQGLAFGYTYDGFTVSRSQNVPNLDNFLKLSLATNAMSATDYRSTLNDLNAKFVNNRQQFDATIREMFHKI
jgi:hypothetical protein